MKQQKKQTKILKFYFIIGIYYMSGFVSFITIRRIFVEYIVFYPNVPCHTQCPLNADKHWDSAGCDLMKNVAPYVTPYVTPGLSQCIAN